MDVTGNPENVTLLRVIVATALNLLLSPLYVLLLVFCFVLSVSPLFPARIARENFKTRLQLGATARVLATTATLFHYVLVAIEDFIFWPLNLITIRDNPTARKEVVNSSIDAANQKKGIIVLSAHFGNIEVTAQCLNSLLCGQVSVEKRIIALAKPGKSEWMTNALAWYRNKRGIEVLWTNRKDLVKAMLQSIKAGRAVALLVDQKPASAGHFIEFFGKQSAFPDGGIEVALRSNANFIFVTSRRIFPGFYTFEGRSLAVSEGNKLDASIVLSEYARWLERVIEISPWQWCWDYKKWSRQPNAGVST